MAFYGYNGDVDGCQWSTPYSDIAYDQDFFPPQSSSTSSFYEFEEPKSIYYYNQFDPDTIQSTVNFSVYGHLETTRLIHYKNQQQQQPSYVIESFYPQTNYITSYSTLEFNETEFEEYDDTPYGGGYDLALTYGKPLPPSDRICYPRSTPPQPGSKFAIPDGFSYGSISSPYGEISKRKPQVPANGVKSDDHDNKKDISTKESFDNGKNDAIIENPIEVDRVDAVVDDLSYNDDDDGDEDEDEDGAGDDDERKGLGNEGYGSHVTKYPYGSGLETFDMCDSIFGYWPCLDKRNQQNLAKSVEIDDQNRMDPWKSAADYLFGSGFVYEESRGMSHGHGYYDDGHHFDYSYN